MAEQLIIGLYSPAQQSGKSTVSNILRLHYGFEHRGFAVALKQMVASLMLSAGLTDEEIVRYYNVRKEDPIPALGGRSFRYLAQTLGTEWGRDLIASDLWVNLVLKNPNLPPLVVIDDLRFPNEYDAIRAEGGQVWRIYRPGQEPTNGHPSEGLLEDREFDEKITNDGSIRDLEVKVKAALTGAV